MLKKILFTFSSLLGFLFFTHIFTHSCLAQEVQITNINNFEFGMWSGSGDLSAVDNICIYKSSGDTSYNILIKGSGPSNEFIISNDSINVANTVPYTVSFQGSATANTNIFANIQQMFSSSSSSQNCGGGTNAFITIKISENALNSAAAGRYNGFLTIMLIP